MSLPASASARAAKLPVSRRGFISRFFFASVGQRRLRPRWRNIVAVALAFPVFVYGVLASTAFTVLRHRGISEVSLVDLLLLPLRWQNVQHVIGRHTITLGLAELEAGRPPEALHLLNAGLRKAPDHRDGRLAAAQLRILFGREDAAQSILLEGLSFHRQDPVYLTTFFRFLLDRQKDNDVIALTSDLLADSVVPLPAAAAETCAMAAATAAFHRGNYDAAEDFLERHSTARLTIDGALLQTRIEWERGHRDLALVRLRNLAADPSAHPSFHFELIGRLREAGKGDEARRRAIAFQISNPTLGRARVDLLKAYHAIGDRAAAAREWQAILREFSSDQATLLSVAEFASDTAQPALAEELIAHARRERLNAEPFEFLHLESLLAARAHSQAIEQIRRLRETLSLTEPLTALLDSLQAVAYFGVGDAGAAKTSLNHFLDSRFARSESLLAVANRFVALDANSEACRILTHAVAREPKNQAALSRLIALELELDRIEELPAHLEKLVETRKPSTDLLRVAHYKLGSDLFLFSPKRDAALDAVAAALERAGEFPVANR